MKRIFLALTNRGPFFGARFSLSDLIWTALAVALFIWIVS